MVDEVQCRAETATSIAFQGRSGDFDALPRLTTIFRILNRDFAVGPVVGFRGKCDDRSMSELAIQEVDVDETAVVLERRRDVVPGCAFVFGKQQALAGDDSAHVPR